MKVEFTIIIKEFMTRKPDSWVERQGSIQITASKKTVDVVVAALESIPDLEVH